MNPRQTDILKRITDLKEVKVTDLAEEFNVSEVTIRKDLNYLEERGLISREFGFARINESDDIRVRLAQNYSTKQKIAQEASKLVQDGDYVLIESGSCCTLLAQELVKNKKDITIITNSAFIADYIHKLKQAKVILLGGDYQMAAQVTVGPVMADNVKLFNVDLAFVGTDGYLNGQFSGSDFMRAQAVKDFAKQANRTVILTDSSKFGIKSRFNHLSNKDVALVITDDQIPDSIKSEFLDSKVDVITIE